MNIYVGNLANETTNNELRKIFEVYGRVDYVNVIRDDITGESKGFGFLEMPDANEAHRAILALNNHLHRNMNFEVCKAPILKDENRK